MRQLSFCGLAALLLLSPASGYGDNAKAQPDSWTGTWHRVTPRDAFPIELRIDGTPPHLDFSLESRLTGRVGALADGLLVRGRNASYRNDNGCRIDFSLSGDRLQLRQHGRDEDCQLGSGVDFSGEYALGKLPAPDLLTLHIVDGEAQDHAAHALLGHDYQALIGAADLVDDGKDLDALGAVVREYLVHTRDTPASAIVMRHGTELWLGLLVADAQREPHLRYYTNVAAWKGRLPKTIQAWRDHNFDKTLPVDLMP